MSLRRLLLVVPLAAAVVWGAAVPAAAGCPAPMHSETRRLNNASTAFIGTVDSTDETGRIANVTVESVWKGDVDDHVQVNGVTNPYSVAPGIDRSFEAGRRYLFVPSPENGNVFKDSSCSLTRPWRANLARHTPEDAEPVAAPPPEPQPEPQTSNRGWWWVAAAVALAVIAVMLVMRRRGRAT